MNNIVHIELPIRKPNTKAGQKAKGRGNQSQTFDSFDSLFWALVSFFFLLVGNIKNDATMTAKPAKIIKIPLKGFFCISILSLIVFLICSTFVSPTTPALLLRFLLFFGEFSTLINLGQLEYRIVLFLILQFTIRGADSSSSIICYNITIATIIIIIHLCSLGSIC